MRVIDLFGKEKGRKLFLPHLAPAIILVDGSFARKQFLQENKT
jgi:hypothetical protein